MEPSASDHLNSHPYQEIFKYLPYNDLLKATLVCKTWNIWISNSKNFKSRTRLVIEDAEEDVTEVQLKRLYESVWLGREIRGFIPIRKVSSKIFKQISLFNETLMELRLSHSKLGASDFLDLLRSCSKIQILVLSYCKLERDSENYEKVALPSSMDTFTFDTDNTEEKSDWILDFLECKRVKHLSLIRRYICSNNEVADHYVRFLNQIKKGEEIKLQLGNVDVSNSNLELNVMFKWNKLSLCTVEMAQLKKRRICNWEKLCNASEENSWLKLCLGQSYQNRFELVPRFMNWTNSINTLEIDVCSMPQREEILRLIENNENSSIVKNLKIYEGHGRIVALNLTSFLTKFDQIDSLEIDALVLEDLDANSIGLNYQKITKFILSQFCCGTDASYSLNDCYGGEKLKLIVFPQIETLEIYGETELLNHEVFEILQCFDRNNPTLRNFRIIFDVALSQTKLEKILIKVFAAMANVESFEIETEVWRRLLNGKRDRRRDPRKHLSLKATRSEISQKYFGNPSMTKEALHFLAALMNQY